MANILQRDVEDQNQRRAIVVIGEQKHLLFPCAAVAANCDCCPAGGDAVLGNWCVWSYRYAVVVVKFLLLKEVHYLSLPLDPLFSPNVLHSHRMVKCLCEAEMNPFADAVVNLKRYSR